MDLNEFYAVPEGTNDRTELYLAALKFFSNEGGLAGDDEFIRLQTAIEETPPPAPGEEWPELVALEKFLKQHEQALNALHEAAAEQGGVHYPSDATLGYAMMLPNVQGIHSAVRMLQLQFLAQMHRHDHAAASKTLLAELRLGETLRDEPVRVSQLVHAAFYSMFRNQLQEYLKSRPGTEGELAKLQTEIAEVDFPRSLTLALIGERALAYETCNSDSDAKWLKVMTDDPFTSEWLPEGQTMASMRPGDVAMTLTLLTEMVEATKHPYPQAADEVAAVNTRMSNFITADMQAMPWNRHVLVQMLLPTMNSAFTAMQKRTAEQRIDLVSVAVERYRLAHGELPTSLDLLVPEFLDAVPEDAHLGKPLEIVITGEEYSISAPYSVEKEAEVVEE